MLIQKYFNIPPKWDFAELAKIQNKIIERLKNINTEEDKIEYGNSISREDNSI